MPTYQEEFQHSPADPSGYWLERAAGVHWSTPPTQGIDSSNTPFNTWFADGEINACYNALDYHVENGRGDQVALIHDSPITSSCTTLSYRHLRDEVARFAGVLKAEGIDEDPSVLDDITQCLRSLGLAKEHS